MADEIEKFVEAFAESLAAGTFVKLTLGNYKGSEEHLQKVLARPVAIKSGRHVAFQQRYTSRETVANISGERAPEALRTYLAGGFRNAHLFTLTSDFQLDIGKRSSRIRRGKPTYGGNESEAHDREKRRFIDEGAYFLKALGITTDAGEVRASQQHKWRQINKFVETLAHLVDNSRLADRKRIKIVDMGCGKGYLTFASYDYFANVRGYEVDSTGVDTKQDTIALCNEVAAACNFRNLDFVVGSIEDFELDSVDLLIALHACDTATDEALFRGVRSGAELIVAAPCCHKEVRRQITPPPEMRNFLKHGVLLERTAETVTDGLRSLLLERSRYATKVFEFVDPENTPKNNMIAATKTATTIDRAVIDAEIAAVKKLYGITHQRLEGLLA